MTDPMRSALVRIRENAVTVAVAQDDCMCHTIPTLLRVSGIDEASIGRVKKVKLHTPASYAPKAALPV
jgi:hypothetical protein